MPYVCKGRPVNECFYMWSPIIWKQTTPTKQFTSRPVLQINICIFVRTIYCFSFNIEPCSFNICNYLQNKKKLCFFFLFALFSLFGAG